MTAENLWSVEIKQPEVMVVRNYTPLPLKFNPASKEIEILKDGDNADGKLSFYIKKYENGEVARWLHHLPKGHIIEIRGPFIDYEFPHLPNELKDLAIVYTWIIAMKGAITLEKIPNLFTSLMT